MQIEIEVRTHCIGDIVVGDNGYVLVCGSGQYADAIIVSVDPLVAISRAGDMLWQATIKDDGCLRSVGAATAAESYHAFQRWFNEKWQEKIRRGELTWNN